MVLYDKNVIISYIIQRLDLSVLKRLQRQFYHQLLV